MSTFVNISKRIKITIPNDPIFSGTYVFDRALGDYTLQSSAWTLNSQLSEHNLNVYDHPESASNNKLLISLNDNGYDVRFPGYNEIKSSLYENNYLANQMEDVFSFPAKFIFTAVQPPCPCSGYVGTAFPPISTQGSGHRLAVGFAPPIRWRHPYDSWIIVDKVIHTISGTIPNYATGVVFNDGTSYFSNIDQTNVFLNNSKSIKYTQSYIPGTQISETRDGYISVTSDNGYAGFWPVCTGLEDFGFAFRVSASGLGIDKSNHSNNLMTDEYTYIQGIGPLQYHETYYTWNDTDGTTTTLVDERPFFEPKIPVTAEIEFTYSCRNGLPCFDLSPVPITDPSITTISNINTSVCDYKVNPNIYLNYLCGGNQTLVPTDDIWINNSITGIAVIFSGISGALPGVTTDSKYSSSKIYDIYASDQEYPIIELPYTGSAVPSLVIDWITNNLMLIDNPNNVNLNSNNFISNLINRQINLFPSVDLYWNIDYPNYNSAVYIVPNETIYGQGLSIRIANAGTDEANGIYVFLNNHYVKMHGSDWKIRLTSMGYIIGTGDTPEEWISYYLLPTTEQLTTPDNTYNWSIPINFVGLAPPPVSITSNKIFA